MELPSTLLHCPVESLLAMQVIPGKIVLPSWAPRDYSWPMGSEQSDVCHKWRIPMLAPDLQSFLCSSSLVFGAVGVDGYFISLGC